MDRQQKFYLYRMGQVSFILIAINSQIWHKIMGKKKTLLKYHFKLFSSATQKRHRMWRHFSLFLLTFRRWLFWLLFFISLSFHLEFSTVHRDCIQFKPSNVVIFLFFLINKVEKTVEFMDGLLYFQKIYQLSLWIRLFYYARIRTKQVIKVKVYNSYIKKKSHLPLSLLSSHIHTIIEFKLFFLPLL